MENQTNQGVSPAPRKPAMLAVIIVAIIVVLGGVYWFIWGRTPKAEPAPVVSAISEAVSNSTLPDFGSTNPLENLPEVNPVDQVNPFKDLRTNPF